MTITPRAMALFLSFMFESDLMISDWVSWVNFMTQGPTDSFLGSDILVIHRSHA